jgi:hypothetical protein
MKNKKTCPKGHVYYKSTDCSTCPICEAKRKPKEGFYSLLSAPARRALEREGIDDVKKLARFTEKEILKLHGLGPSTIPKLKRALEKEGLSFMEK